MTKFKIDVCRIGYGCKTLEVEAATLEEAQIKAMNDAGNHVFNEHHADVELPGDNPLLHKQRQVDEARALELESWRLFERAFDAMARMVFGVQSGSKWLLAPDYVRKACATLACARMGLTLDKVRELAFARGRAIELIHGRPLPSAAEPS